MRTTLFAFVFLLTNSLFGQQNLELLSNYTFSGASLAGCWHYNAADGTPYALVGTSIGVSILDLSNPAQPVEVFVVPSLPNNWREVKTHGDFAYVATEAIGSGIQILDLSGLPDTVVWKNWFGDAQHTDTISTCHALAIDDGYMYLFGGSRLSNGAVICSLSDPWNPKIVGTYNDFYVHDGYVRNDTLWTAEIYKGQFSVIDVSDKTQAIRLTSVPTPGAFTHTTWLSDDGQYCFTSDERQNTPMASFKVSDIQDIEQLGSYFPSQKPTNEVHNLRVKGRYVVNACYGGQLTIVDAKRPNNLVETAWAVVGTSLVWDVDPYLSDSFLFATAKVEGLFVFKPIWTPAAWLEGVVTDASTGFPVPDAEISISSIQLSKLTNGNGQFKTGSPIAGNYTVIASKTGYISDTLSNIVLKNDSLSYLEFVLQPLPTSTHGLNPTDIKVFPNTFSDKLTIQLNDFCKACTVELSTIQGQIVKSLSFSGQQTNLDNLQYLPLGSYQLLMKKENGESWVRTVLKQ